MVVSKVKLVMKLLIYFLLIVCSSLAEQEFYKAAVVEYAPIRNSDSLPTEVIADNIREYVKLIEQAGHSAANIIVFPEDGLTTLEVSNKPVAHLHGYSVVVPKVGFNPCSNRSDVNKPLVDLSCAAAKNGIYTAVNLLEEDNTDESKPAYYNAIVVFDRNGTIIARYRKMNLFHESSFNVGKDIVTFDTDFGVTFGVFICFDILFEKPAIKVLANASVTDIIFATAWFSETPFLSALTAQSSYAIGNGINLLASGYSDPPKGNGGSGIYLANGTIAKTFISGNATNKLIMQNVPIIKKRTPPTSCKNSVNIKLGENIIVSDVSNFKTIPGLFNFTLKPLNTPEIRNGTFSCKFEITLEENTSSSDMYEYKLAQFFGVQKYGDRKAGVRSCAVVACYNNTCGAVVKGIKTPKIKHLLIKAQFKKRTEFIAPSGVTTNLVPASGYSFCMEEKDYIVTVTINSTEVLDSVVGLGFYSRVYSDDGNEVGPEIDNGTMGDGLSRGVIIGIISAIIIAVLVGTLLLMKNRRKYSTVNGGQ